jgi:putative membrane-bound dehydrogenase-like protein
MKEVLKIANTSIFILIFFFNSSCKNQENSQVKNNKADSLAEVQKHLAENALKGLDISDGLDVHSFATEPMLKNPTNIDVDERGRVWVTEAYNYRPAINGNPTNPKGDRIVILEDTNGDGKADTAKVFYQGPELNAPLGICVLGKRVIVSQSPYVWSFYDDNGDDVADRKEILFQGIGGEQHDHGAHAFTFGADGKLYFNFGNEGKTLKDKNGKTVLDQDGEEIGPKKYQQGMVFRCDPDGSHVECLGNNFRNPYEVAVDSYGSLWQSDNDDDGNKGTRINYVMPYGNYGYKDELTGAGWEANRTNIEDSIPQRHWHLNDPGEVPNLLQTGAGSPTGMLVYEGTLLPKEFQDQLIHSDAGPNVVRSYSLQNSGAGYTASIINILKGDKDQWFRPADVCVAPDGSLIVADWYDPGVGGHQAGDQTRGRIYRVAPPTASSYLIFKQDYSTPAGAVLALQNPNLSVRYHAFTALQTFGNQSIPELEKLWNGGGNPKMRARAFWALVKLPLIDAKIYIDQAVKDKDPNIRMVAIRAAAELKQNLTPLLITLVNDPDVQVRREVAIALHHNKSTEAAAIWATLASKHDGKDRWYLEALGIGADRQWDLFFKSYLTLVKDPLKDAAGKDIVWRARTDEAVPYLAKLAVDEQVVLKDRLRYFRAFDFNAGTLKSGLLLKMIADNKNKDIGLNKLVLFALDNKSVNQSPIAQQALQEVIRSVFGTQEYIDLVKRYQVKSESNNLLQLAISKKDENIGKQSTGLLLSFGGSKQIWSVLNGKDSIAVKSLLSSLGQVGSKESIDIVQTIALSDKYALDIRKDAARKIGRSWNGEERVLAILKNKKVPQDLIPDVVASVSGAWRGSVRSEAESYLPGHVSTTTAAMPTLSDINALTGDMVKGKTVFTNSCALCHQVNATGYDFGPKLSEIGSKYPKEGLLNAILHPSEGISFGFEGWTLKLKDGSSVTGIIASKTETDIDLKLPGGSKQQLKTSQVQSIHQLKESMMPEGLYKTMSKQDMADLLAYLQELKKK